MRRIGLLLLALALPLTADEVVLKDGRTLKTTGPYKTKGKLALLKLQDGTLLSVNLSEIDLEKTAEAKMKAEAPVAAPVAAEKPKAKTAADAVSKGPRKSTVSLTDKDVSHAIDSGSSGAKGEGSGSIEITGFSAVKNATGYAISGSAFNGGKADVTGVSVVVEVIGADNKTLNTLYAVLAKDSVAAGEKVAFQAQASETADVTFRYFARWKVSASGTTGEAAKTDEENKPAAVPTKAPEAAPTPRVQLAPGMAPPLANAPVGAPAKPGQPYLPASTGNQPKPLE